jgi:sulfotransferase
MKQFVCLSGLPRTGSTLLSAILSQNPLIHAEGNSAVCQIMWDTLQSCKNGAKEQLAASRREGTIRDILSQIPHLYYKDIKEPIVVDKCRSWTMPPNLEILQTYIDVNYKIIVLERPVVEIVASFVKLYRDNGKILNAEMLLRPQSEPIMRSIAGINWAKKNNYGHFLFISYNDLIQNTEATIKKIYDFCGWAEFKHDFTNIKVKYPEDDTVYQLAGQHSIRSTIQKRNVTAPMSEAVIQQCAKIDSLMGYNTK